jgi:hypothetical protein
MFFRKIISWYLKNRVKKTVAFVLFLVVFVNFFHGRYNKPDGVIQWDIKSYYAYLPATFIYKDLSLQFRQDNLKKFGDLIWPIETPIGKKAIITTMGMSILYTPFFLVAHTVALLTLYEADGYSIPYKFALTFSALFYFWLGLHFLIKILRKHFEEKVIAFTILGIGLGTNLFYYTTYEAPMTHAYNFALITAFIWLTIRFYENPSIKRILLSGTLAGLITLIRPTNIIVLLIFFLWNIKSWNCIKSRFSFFIKHFHWILIMAGAFILIWIPQFIYWYNVSGTLFYFSYGEAGGSFFFNNPQIFNILFSYKKGWLVYTPIMIFSLGGLILLPKRLPGSLTSILTFTIFNIYILASWWSWWFGGGFGLRAFIDSYGILAIPFACFVDFSYNLKYKWKRIVIFSVLTLLIGFNQFQTRQYVNAAIHWWWMNKEAYWETFLKLRPTERFWEVVTLPDYDAARKGIYREIKPKVTNKTSNVSEWKHITEESLLEWLSLKIKNDTAYFETLNKLLRLNTDTLEVIRTLAQEKIMEKGFDFWNRKMGIELLVKEIKGKPDLLKQIEEKANKKNNPLDSQVLYDAIWIYNREMKKK